MLWQREIENLLSLTERKCHIKDDICRNQLIAWRSSWDHSWRWPASGTHALHPVKKRRHLATSMSKQLTMTKNCWLILSFDIEHEMGSKILILYATFVEVFKHRFVMQPLQFRRYVAAPLFHYCNTTDLFVFKISGAFLASKGWRISSHTVTRFYTLLGP